MQRLQAPAGGKLYLGYDNSEVNVPGLGRCLRFQYVTEPPHGDALLRLVSDGHPLPGLVWGSETWWSPNARWLLLQWSDERPGFSRDWRLIDLLNWGWTLVDIGSVSAMDDETIRGHAIGGAPTTLRIENLPDWADCRPGVG